MTEQLTAADLETMTPDQISAAYEQGHCAALLGANPTDVAVIVRAADATLTRNDVTHLRRLGRHDLIADAFNEDRIDYTNPKDNS